MIQASHTQVDYWRTICHQSRNTVDPEYFRLQSKVLQLINLDRITICHQAERWAVLKEQQNGERFFLHRCCTYTVFTVHCSLFSIQQQITSKCLTRSPGQRLVRFPNPLATGRQSWQLGNLTRQREGKTYSCGVVQITSVYAYMHWKLWALESHGNWSHYQSCILDNWNFHPRPHQGEVGFLWFHRDDYDARWLWWEDRVEC